MFDVIHYIGFAVGGGTFLWLRPEPPELHKARSDWSRLVHQFKSVQPNAWAVTIAFLALQGLLWPRISTAYGNAVAACAALLEVILGVALVIHRLRLDKTLAQKKEGIINSESVAMVMADTKEADDLQKIGNSMLIGGGIAALVGSTSIAKIRFIGEDAQLRGAKVLYRSKATINIHSGGLYGITSATQLQMLDADNVPYEVVEPVGNKRNYEHH